MRSTRRCALCTSGALTRFGYCFVKAFNYAEYKSVCIVYLRRVDKIWMAARPKDHERLSHLISSQHHSELLIVASSDTAVINLPDPVTYIDILIDSLLMEVDIKCDVINLSQNICAAVQCCLILWYDCFVKAFKYAEYKSMCIVYIRRVDKIWVAAGQKELEWTGYTAHYFAQFGLMAPRSWAAAQNPPLVRDGQRYISHLFIR
jgi:hypothetical protein